MRTYLASLGLLLAATGCGDSTNHANPGAADAAPIDGAVCDVAGYPIDATPTRAENDATVVAAMAFQNDSGATVGFDQGTGGVTDISGGTIPVTLDPLILDPCARAEAGLRAFFAAHADFLHLPDDMMVRQCSFDSITNSDLVRLSGGTYLDQRARVGGVNDLNIHVARTGTISFWAGGYLPVRSRPASDVCIGLDLLDEVVIGQPLGYLEFHACVPGDPGEIDVAAADTRNVGTPAVFLDQATNELHEVRLVEVLLDASRVTEHEIDSDLFCCSGSTLDGCVGAFLVVDEVTGETLRQLPRCLTC